MVNLADLAIITANLNAGCGGSFGTPLSAVFGPSAVPEPGSLGLLAFAGFVLLRRARS
jgi:hypothetical protein